MDVPESLTLMPSESAAEAGDELAVRFHLASATLSALVAGVGLAVLIGWWVESPALTSVLPGLVAMKANAAFGLALTGAAVWLHRLPDAPAAARVAMRVCAAAAAAVALLTIAEFVTGWNLHVDQILAIDHSTAGAPGRMALATAVCLALLDGAVVLAARPARYAVAELLVGAAFMLATLCGFGYFFVLDAADAGVGYGFMAVHTSVGLLLLCLAFLFARPDDGLMATIIDSGPGGLIIRRLLPVLFVVPLLLAWLSWVGVRAGSYEPGFAVALFATLTVFALGVALVAGGRLLRRFEDRRIAAETELARSEERLRRAVTDAPIPMVIHDGDAILEMSAAWAETSGYTQADTPTLSAWTARTQAQAADRMAAHLAHLAQATGTVPAGEQPVRTRDGGTRIWDLSSTPLGSPAAGSRLFVTMGVDVTARKQADAELRLLNDSLEHRIAERTVELTRVNDALKRQSDQLEEQATLLDLVRDGILVRDLYGTIIYWNAGAADLYGWTKDEALGRVSHQLLRAEYPRPSRRSSSTSCRPASGKAKPCTRGATASGSRSRADGRSRAPTAAWPKASSRSTVTSRRASRRVTRCATASGASAPWPRRPSRAF